MTSRSPLPRLAEHPSVAHEAAILRNLAARTGHPLDHWLAQLAHSGETEARARVRWLQTACGLGRDTARVIVAQARGGDAEPDATASDAPVDALARLFSGPRAALRPVADAVLAAAAALGPDVVITPGATIVPIRRRHVFAQIRPASRTRVDVGLALRAHPGPLPDRLVDTGGAAKGDRITHRIAIASVDAVDDEVRAWLSVAYALDA